MNTKQFVSLFFAFCASVSIGLTTTVVDGLVASLPLLSATSGTIALPLAVLGVLKLAAAASLAFGLGAKNLFALPQIAAPGRSLRFRRSAEDDAENKDAIFALVSSMDLLSCGKALICGLQSRDHSTLAEDEKLMLTLFADHKSKRAINPLSAKAEYDLASDLGLITRNEVACRKRYSTCPYTAEEMMNALRSSHL